MTNPSLSLQTTEDIGRVYQMPGSGYDKKLNTKQVLEGLNRNDLFPSITNVIGCIDKSLQHYYMWAIREGLKKSSNIYEALGEPAAYTLMTSERGTRVHAFCEDFVNAGLNDISWYTMYAQKAYRDLPAYKALQEHHAESNDLDYVPSFLMFLKEKKPRFIHQEATVYGSTREDGLINYAGTTDFIAEIDGKIVCGDYKTSKNMKSTVGLQLAAVTNATLITTDFKTLSPMIQVDETYSIQIQPSKEYGYFKTMKEPEAWEMFKHARGLWEFVAFKGDGMIEQTNGKMK